MPKEFMVVLVGTGGVGKSTLAVRFVEEKFVLSYDPTIEDIFSKDMEIDGTKCRMNILDIAGGAEMEWEVSYKVKGQGYILCYQVDKQWEIDGLVEEYQGLLAAQQRDSIPCVIIGTKCDILSEMEDSIQVDEEKAKKFAASIGAKHFLTSAKEDININEAFQEIAALIVKDVPAKTKSCALM